MFRRALGASLVMTGTALLVACGFGASANPSATVNAPAASLAPCAALSQSEAASITGDPAVAAISGGAASTGDQCRYLDVSAATVASAEIVLQQNPGAVSAQVLQQALGSAATTTSGAYQQVQGVGDVAYSEMGVNQAGLVFAKGETIVVIVASSGVKSDADMLNAIQHFASGLAGRL